MKQVTSLLRTWIAAVMALVALPLAAQTTYTVGTPASTTTNNPVNSNWGFNYTQQIFTPAQLNLSLIHI